MLCLCNTSTRKQRHTGPGDSLACQPSLVWEVFAVRCLSLKKKRKEKWWHFWGWPEDVSGCYMDDILISIDACIHTDARTCMRTHTRTGIVPKAHSGRIIAHPSFSDRHAAQRFCLSVWVIILVPFGELPNSQFFRRCSWRSVSQTPGPSPYRLPLYT